MSKLDFTPLPQFIQSALGGEQGTILRQLLESMQVDVCEPIAEEIQAQADDELAALDAGFKETVGIAEWSEDPEQRARQEKVERAWLKWHAGLIGMNAKVEASIFWAGVRFGMSLQGWLTGAYGRLAGPEALGVMVSDNDEDDDD